DASRGPEASLHRGLPIAPSPFLRIDRWLQLAFVAAAIIITGIFGTFEALAPIPVVVDRFIPDDALYYFTTAGQFASSLRPTFDGVNITSGFHPLWFLACSAVYASFPIGSPAAIRILLLAQVILLASASRIVFGSLLGLLFLARTDQVFVVISYSVA